MGEQSKDVVSGFSLSTYETPGSTWSSVLEYVTEKGSVSFWCWESIVWRQTLEPCPHISTFFAV